MFRRLRAEPLIKLSLATLCRLSDMDALTSRSLDLERLGSRHNSLNLMRLVFAMMVLVAHAFYVTGNPPGPIVVGENLGGWGVIGFFTLSGYLVTGSRLRSPLREFLLHRAARIFPAFWVCLFIIAFVFAPIAYVTERGTFEGFLTTPVTPLAFVLKNAALYMVTYNVAGTLSSAPFPTSWNGSLWSLSLEFLCYLLIGTAACFKVFRRLPGIVALYVSSVALYAALPLAPVVGHLPSLVLLAKLVPYFLGGAVVFAARDRLQFRRSWAMPCLALVIGVVCLVNARLGGAWGGQAVAPLITYLCLWIALRVQVPRWLQKNDSSYGVYIYAWPMQQLVVLSNVGGTSHSVVANVLLAAPLAFGLATVSWFVIERPIMRRVREMGSQAHRIPRPRIAQGPRSPELLVDPPREINKPIVERNVRSPLE